MNKKIIVGFSSIVAIVALGFLLAGVGNLVYQSSEAVIRANDFGVNPGATDNSVALQNLINIVVSNNTSPAIISFLPGRYNFRQTVTVPAMPYYQYGIEFRGAGVARTEFLCVITNVPLFDVLYNSLVGGARSVKFTKLSMIGPLVNTGWDTAASTTIAIRGGSTPPTSIGGTQWEIDDCKIAGFETGLSLSNIWQLDITRCLFQSNRLCSVFLAPAFFWTMNKCQVMGDVNGREGGIGINCLPAGGICGRVSDSYFLLLTNAIINYDQLITYVGVSWERCGCAIYGLSSSYNHILGSAFSELWNQSPSEVGMTNGFRGWFQADGIAARGFIFENMGFEDVSPPSRSFFYSMATNASLFSWTGTNFFRPVFRGGLRDTWVCQWGTNGLGDNPMPMFRDGSTAPIFDAPVGITNSLWYQGNQIPLSIQNGSSDRGIVVGGDATLNTSTVNWQKYAGIGAYAYWANSSGAFQPQALISYRSQAATDNGDVYVGGSGAGAGLLGANSVNFVTSTNGGGGTTGTPRWKIGPLGDLINTGNAGAGALVDQNFRVTTGNYSMVGQESIVMMLGNRHTDLPGPATNVGKFFTIICYSAGTNGIYPAGGVGACKISGYNDWTNQSTGRGVRLWCDGTNYWVMSYF